MKKKRIAPPVILFLQRAVKLQSDARLSPHPPLTKGKKERRLGSEGREAKAGA